MSQTQTEPRTVPAAPDASCCAHHGAFEILHDCHEHILERLARLETLGRELQGAAAFEERHLAVVGDLLSFLHTAIPIHSADEERTLFPRLRAAHPASGYTPMDCMEREHVDHQAQLARFERAVVKRDAPAAARAALDVVASYRDHIGKEEEILFPWAREVLSDPALVQAMTREMRERRMAAGLLGC
jgi:iron-sulfur cluster repair protein YtfE (RIC family)